MTRRTKILATLGPGSESVEGIAGLIEAGADAFRLNFSHGTRESHALTAQRIREVAAATGRSATILQDLSGPKIRIGALADLNQALADAEAMRLPKALVRPN